MKEGIHVFYGPFLFSSCHLPSPPGRCRIRRSIRGGKLDGVYITDAGTRGRLEGCDIAGNGRFGVQILGGADPSFSACKYVPRMRSSSRLPPSALLFFPRWAIL